MLTGGALAVVVITDNDPLDALIAVLSSDGRYALPFTSDLVLDLVSLPVGGVYCTDQAVFCEK